MKAECRPPKCPRSAEQGERQRSIALEDCNALPLVRGFLGVSDLSRYGRVGKHWRADANAPALWRALYPSLDPMNALGAERLRELEKRWPIRRIAQQLCSQMCSICSERHKTALFFVLTCSRVCANCFHSRDEVEICSVAWAKRHFLLSPTQVETLPVILVDADKTPEEEAPSGSGLKSSSTGGGDGSVAVTTVAAARASAVARFGSAEALEEELARLARLADVEYNEGVAAVAEQNAPESHALLAPPRLRSDDFNTMGALQRSGAIDGEDFGLLTVISRAFFEETGKRISVGGESGPCIVSAAGSGSGSGGVGGGSGGGCGEEEEGSSARYVELARALADAPPGSVVTLHGKASLLADLVICKPLLLKGAERGTIIEAAPATGASLRVAADCCMISNLTVKRVVLDWMTYSCPRGGCDTDCSSSLTYEVTAPAIAVACRAACIVDGCSVGPCDQGPSIAAESGKVLITGCSFVGPSGDPEDVGGCVAASLAAKPNRAPTITLVNNDLRGVSLAGPEGSFAQNKCTMRRLNRMDCAFMKASHAAAASLSVSSACRAAGSVCDGRSGSSGSGSSGSSAVCATGAGKCGSSAAAAPQVAPAGGCVAAGGGRCDGVSNAAAPATNRCSAVTTGSCKSDSATPAPRSGSDSGCGKVANGCSNKSAEAQAPKALSCAGAAKSASKCGSGDGVCNGGRAVSGGVAGSSNASRCSGGGVAGSSNASRCSGGGGGGGSGSRAASAGANNNPCCTVQAA